MAKFIYILLILALPMALYSQCESPSLFLNASFEEQSCCPSFLGQFNCLDHWEWPHPLASPDYHHACDFEGSVNNPPIYAYAHGYPDGMGRVNMNYCHINSSSEMIQTCTEEPLSIMEEYTFSAYLGMNRATTQGVLMPTKLALYGSIGNCGVTASFAGNYCPPQPQWELLTEISYAYEGEQGWTFGHSTCFQPTQPFNRFVIGTSCDIMQCGGIVLDIVELHTCRQLLAVDMEITPNTCLTHPNGAINLSVQGNSGPYTYDWAIDGIGDADDEEDLIGIIAGSYPVTVTDASGLSRCLNIFVPEDITPPIPTYFLPIGPLCHNSTPPILRSRSQNTPEVTGTWLPATINTTTIGLSDYIFFPDSTFCADTFILSIEILKLRDTIINYSGCIDDGYSIEVNNTLYDETNPIGQEIIISSIGCDSTIIIDLTFSDEITQDILYIGCVNDGYIIVVNNTLYDENNARGVERLKSSLGCDSVIDVNLAFMTRRDSQVLYRGCTGDGYSLTVNNVLYDERHPSGVELIPQPGCDISLVIDLFFDPIIQFEETLIFNQGEFVELNLENYVNNIESPIISIIWEPSNNLTCSDCMNPIFSGDMKTEIIVEIIDEKDCVHHGKYILLPAQNDIEFFIPTSFTPNNDGINDEFRIYTDINSTIQISTFDIYDRWGNRVFHRSNVNPRDDLAAWNGEVPNKAANQGIYVYIIKGTDFSQIAFTRYGHVTLLR